MTTRIQITSELLAAGPVKIEWGGKDSQTRVHIATDGPSKWRLAENFVRSGVAHLAEGMPKAGDADVAARWAICQANGCGLFRKQGTGKGFCAHPQCGCHLRALGTESMTTPNKLRWADQKCPAGLWGTVAAVDTSDKTQE